jgi:lipoate-protein ligase A
VDRVYLCGYRLSVWLQVYADVFAVLPRNAAQVPASRRSEITKDTSATFALKDNDFTFAGKKIAGNAQALVKGRWLQHTSFLWDYRPDRMALLREPTRRPEYRGKRKHSAFLTPVISLGFNRQMFVDTVEDALTCRGFDVQPVGTRRLSWLLAPESAELLEQP